jgi:hypothetical protein
VVLGSAVRPTLITVIKGYPDWTCYGGYESDGPYIGACKSILDSGASAIKLESVPLISAYFRVIRFSL